MHQEAEAMTALPLVVEKLSEELLVAWYLYWYQASENVVCGADDLHAPLRKSTQTGEERA